MSSRYREHAPPAALGPWVECFWTRLGERPTAQRVLPDGCADLLLDLGESTRPMAWVVGPMTRSLVVPPGPALHRLVAVRFRPGAARGVLGLPLDVLRDQTVELRALWRDGAALVERVAAAGGEREAVATLSRLIGERCARLPTPDRLVHAAIGRLQAPGGEPSIAALSAALGVTRQHLARCFRAEVGHGPKVLARVLRLQRVLRLARRAGHGTLADLAVAAGYFDQAHLNADCRALAGVPPSLLLRESMAPPPA